MGKIFVARGKTTKEWRPGLGLGTPKSSVRKCRSEKYPHFGRKRAVFRPVLNICQFRPKMDFSFINRFCADGFQSWHPSPRVPFHFTRGYKYFASLRQKNQILNAFALRLCLQISNFVKN